MSVTGFLVSQVGYDEGSSVRAIIRGPADLVESRAAFQFIDEEGEPVCEGMLHLWGTQWGSYWWIADAGDLSTGVYRAVIFDAEHEWISDVIEVGPHMLWDRTWRHVGVEQAERRAIFGKGGNGWQDCGSTWQEANSHAAYVLGFLDLLEFAADRIDGNERARIERQIVNGLDYLARLQDHALTRGHPDGSLSHQFAQLAYGSPNYEDVVLPGDAAKAAVAWARASIWLSDAWPEKRAEYRSRAERSLAYLRTAAPYGEGAMARRLHGAPVDYDPKGDTMTRDLVMRAWAAVELYEWDEAEALLDEVFARQVREDEAEDGLYGHFFTFADRAFTEKAWIHHIDQNVFSPDAGGHFPHYLVPALTFVRVCPNHPKSPLYREGLRSFAENFLLPACSRNPFHLLPQGYYPGEGWVWFAGLWHGINGVYPLTAALALDLERELDTPGLHEVATGNLQWIAGLNAGITRDSLQGSVLWSADLPEDTAVAVSMIHGIGHRYAGSWLTIRGSICNGFSTGAQFRFDVPPTAENDAPSSFTDEDWISHAGAWLSAIARL